MTDSVMRRARFLVIEALYESETSDHPAEEAFNRRVEDIRSDDPDVAAEGPSGFGRGVLRGVVKRMPELNRSSRRRRRSIRWGHLPSLTGTF